MLQNKSHITKEADPPHLLRTSKSEDLFAKKSYSQSGEDMIIDFIFKALEIPDPTYLDLGAHHPRLLSNTHSFYLAGSHGVNVEADPNLYQAFLKERPLDKNLNIGVGVFGGESLPFYIMSTPTLNTFSKEEAERYSTIGDFRIEKVIDVPIVGVNEIIDQNFDGAVPDLITIDVEGLDQQIIESINLERYRPTVICVETITFSVDFSGKKIGEIEKYLITKGYFLYADTFINSIFVDKMRWRPKEKSE
ncbi:FkbM family methyltransferase [Polynucleobacter paneuropaeus]|nr:FkbM family methyltransferase [Polynucleobacter paneuropaeus]